MKTRILTKDAIMSDEVHDTDKKKIYFYGRENGITM